MSLRPEMELIAACASPAPDSVQRARRLVRHDLDWTLLLSMARRHGVLGSVHERLEEAPGAPADVRAYLQRNAAWNLERNRRFLADLHSLLGALHSQGVDAVPLRSAWLGSPLHEVVDLDVLVGAHDVPNAERTLDDLGFRPEKTLTAAELVVLRRTGFARRFVNAHGTVASVQWRVLPCALAHGAPLSRLWRERRAEDHAGLPGTTLAPGSLLELLALRGTAYRWHRLVWIREVALLLGGTDRVELAKAAAQARACGGLRALHLAALLASELLGADGGDLTADACRDRVAVTLARETVAELSRPTRGLPGPAEIARYQRRARERHGDRIAYIARRVLTPTLSDAVAVPVPPAFFFLLYAVRPARLLAATRPARRRRTGEPPGRLVRFTATPPQITDRMLALAAVTEDDTLCDVGCGDGSIIVRAAAHTGCQAIGVDVDPHLIRMARARAQAAGVEDRVELVCADVRTVDLSRATVVTLYLNAATNLVLRPLLWAQLRPGARIVSRNFEMADWLSDASEVIEEAAWGSETIYLWRVTGAAPAGDASALLTPAGTAGSLALRPMPPPGGTA